MVEKVACGMAKNTTRRGARAAPSRPVCRRGCGALVVIYLRGARRSIDVTGGLGGPCADLPRRTRRDRPRRRPSHARELDVAIRADGRGLGRALGDAVLGARGGGGGGAVAVLGLELLEDGQGEEVGVGGGDVAGSHERQKVLDRAVAVLAAELLVLVLERLLLDDRRAGGAVPRPGRGVRRR
eukprot:CAMPEP_0185689354 /NCGR_PEP_ID=MMETSP1164-20130828/404_1 /TAXON_ID=1104430 /ORGANISM="Chrysoreinhardia sp, Strain CCMP2950" /LENGTH=182 /DNA_ID=CAMNT_0028355843 /DNA_START=100 /DNA_END=644 /DNA_ORIENTATION=-